MIITHHKHLIERMSEAAEMYKECANLEVSRESIKKLLQAYRELENYLDYLVGEPCDASRDWYEAALEAQSRVSEILGGGE